MRKNILEIAVALSDADLLARIDALAGTEREATAELVAHLAALELRPSAYLAQGYGSLFDYCRQALRLSEDAACTRIKVARACRQFPAILDLLASGALSLTAVRMLVPHLTEDNHDAVLARARDAALDDIKALVAELAPRPDVAASVRKLPVARRTPLEPAQGGPSELALPLAAPLEDGPPRDVVAPAMLTDSVSPREPPKDGQPQDGLTKDAGSADVTAALLPTTPPTRRPIVEALAPERYRLQCTIGQQTHDKLRRLQALLRREIPDGDPAAIIDRGFDLLLEKVEKAKLGLATKPRRRAAESMRSTESRPSSGAYETRIRFKTDKAARPPGRHIPNSVKNAVWLRDGGQCAFVAGGTGRRCSERTFLEFHHIHPYALDGPATVENISLRCRRHNQYEAELVFGPRDSPTVSETRESYSSAWRMA
jgi:5-methylcytosine-specific restriction endonuclease McrA